MRIFILLALATAAVYTAPVFLDLTTVNTFLTTLATSDVRTDSQVTLDYQNMASKKSPDHDNAKLPLFTTVDSTVSSGSIYTAIANLLKFYTHDSETAQTLTTDMQTAISDFLDKIIATSAVTQAQQFLVQQGVSSSDAATFKTQLYNLWFLPYARTSVVGSSGFKSVFVGESTGTSITRFANWYGFYVQEQSGDINYHGWFEKLNGIAIDLQFVIGTAESIETAFLLNTSPDFDFAAITVAALTATQPTFTVQGDSITLTASTITSNGAVVLDQVTVAFAESATKTTKSGSATTKKPVTADAALQTLVDTMWTEDQDRPTSSQVTMDWGTHISGKTGTKQANLFTTVDETIFTKQQYADLITTYDKDLFTADVCVAEPAMAGFRKQYLQAVFDTFTATPMFTSAFAYLQAQNVAETSTLANFKTKTLWPLWFGTYTRCKGALGSSGWEHVFSGEIRSNEVDGQHDWVRYYLQQKADKMVYDGYYDHFENIIGTFQYYWNGAEKPTGGFFTGSSPAFDFSILSVCALVHGNGANCHFTVEGHAITVTSYTQACGDGSGTCLSTAYPSG